MTIQLPDASWLSFTFADINATASSMSAPSIVFYDSVGSIVSTFSCANTKEQAGILLAIDTARSEGKDHVNAISTSTPTITSLSPSSGAHIGDIVIVYGTDFREDAVITIGGNQLVKQRWLTRYFITGEVPVGVSGSTVDVVYTDGQGNTVTDAASFTYA